MKTKIIAEIGYNHNGSLKLAKEMIDQVSDLKLFAVKFQKWDIESFPEKIKIRKRIDKNSYGITYYEHRKKLELSTDQILELKKYSEKKGLIFICSGKDFNSIKELYKAGIKNIKIPSQLWLNEDIFNYLDKRDCFILASTGMHFEEELIRSRLIQRANVIMHCVNNYPVCLNDCDINVIKRYKFYNGYSSHEIEGRAIKYAVAVGAEYIERHFTFDKNSKGTDHFISSDYKEMQRIIDEIKEVEMIVGEGRRLNELEIRNMQYYRGLNE